MKPLWTTIFFVVVSLAACSNMTGLWQLDWQSMSMSYCIPDFLTISEDDQGNFTAVFNYTQATVTAHCAQNFTGNYSSNLTYNASTNAWMDSTNIQLSYNDSTDTLRYLYPGPTVQILYDRNGSYILQNISMPFIGAVWTNITVTNLTGEGCSCTPSSILITQSPQATGLISIEPTFSSSDCYGLMNVTLGMIFIPDLQLLKWTGPATGSGTTNVYIFDPYTSVNQLTVQVWAWNASASASTNICQYSAQRFTDFTPLNGTWYLDWQSNSLALFVPGSIQATPEDNGAYISTYITYSLGNGTGYLIGGPNNQYFDSFKGLSFTYDEQTNTLLGFPNARFSYSVLFSPNGNLISNTFVDSNWTSPVLANGSSVPSTCCIPNAIRLTPGSNNQTLEAEYSFDQDYESNAACQSLSQDITTNPYYVELQISNPDISKLLWTDIYNSIISFANATTTSEITVQDFMDQPQCTFNMVINSSNPNPTPLSANLMVSEIAFIIIGIFMMLNWI